MKQPSHNIDYRLGWRWLLPYVHGQRLYLGGFTIDEQVFWKQSLSSIEWVLEPIKADGWIYNANDTSIELAKEFIKDLPETVQWVVFIGEGAVVRLLQRQLPHEFGIIHEYGLLPVDSPRLVIPLSHKSHTVTALTLHRPGRWIAQLGVKIALMLTHLGINFPLRRRVLLVATRAPIPSSIVMLNAVGIKSLPVQGMDFALYLGTPGPNRKTVALPLSKMVPDVIIKIGESVQACLNIQNEAATLSFLTNTPMQQSRKMVSTVGEQKGHTLSVASQVPRMLGLIENEHGVALYQEYRPRLNVRAAVLEKEVIHFLVQLTTIEQRSRPLQKVLTETILRIGTCGLSGQNESAMEAICRWLKNRAEEGISVYEHRCHGDFAPWNCAMTTQGFFVFDWEDSQSQALAFGDAFYFAIAPTLHLQGQNQAPCQALAKALSLSELVATRCSFMKVDVRVYFALWLLENHITHSGYAHIVECLAKELTA